MAGIKRETRQIGASEYTVFQLPFGQARKLLLRLMKLAAPALGAAASGGLAALVGAGSVRALFDGLDDDSVEEFAEALGGVSRVKNEHGVELALGKRAVRDGHFGAVGLFEHFEWLKFGLEVNYSDFFDDLKARLPGKKPAAEASEPSP
jgi:hypothetical protein